MEVRESSRGMQTSRQIEVCHDFLCLVPKDDQAGKLCEISLFLPNSEVRIQTLVTTVVFLWSCAEIVACYTSQLASRYEYRKSPKRIVSCTAEL